MTINKIFLIPAILISLTGVVFHHFEIFLFRTYIPMVLTSLIFALTYLSIFLSVKQLSIVLKEADKPFYKQKSFLGYFIFIAINPIVYMFFHRLNAISLILELLMFMPPLFLTRLKMKSNSNRYLIFSVVLGFSQTLLMLFQWELIGRLPIGLFFLPMALLILNCINFVLLICIVVSLIKNRNITSLHLAGLIALALAFSMHFLPIVDWDVKVFFALNKGKMEESIKLIKMNEIKAKNSYGLADLPAKLASCSRRSPGEIHISQSSTDLNVMFYTFCGILDNFSGIIYSENDSIPKNKDFSADSWQTIRLEKNWYFCASR